MKANPIFLIPAIFLFTSCYLYKPYVEKKESEKIENNRTQPKSFRSSAKSEKMPTLRDNNGASEEELIKLKEEQILQEELQKKELLNQEIQKIRNKDIPENEKDIQKGKLIEKMEIESKNNMSFSTIDNSSIPTKSKENQTKNKEEKSNEPAVLTLKEKIEPNKYYKILVEGKQYKIQADQWEGDTLVAHKLRSPKKVYRFHKNQIDEENLLERRFSKPFSDLFTVGAYIAGGVAVLLIFL